MADPQPPVTHRRVLHIALPIVISNATVPILGAVDTGVVGQMGAAAPIGAVGMGAIILSAFYWIFGFLRMGTVGLVAQALGDHDAPEVTALLIRGLIIGAGAGVVLVLLQMPLFHLAFLASPASPEVETLARDYMAIRIWSAPAMISLYAVTGWLIAQERTRAVLAIQLWMNGLNIVLDLWFVLGLEWGVEGVAIATFIAEWSGALLGLWFCRGVFRGPDWRRLSVVFAPSRWGLMVRLNTDILIRSLLLEAIFVSFMFTGADLGDVTLATNQVLLQFILITSYILDGFAFAAEAIVGRAVGARQRMVLRRGAMLSSFWAFSLSGVLALGVLFSGPAVVDLMATDPDVQQTARQYLPYLVATPVISCAAFMLDGIFVGATRSRDMRNMMIVSFAIYAASAAMMVPAFGNHGLWLALLISFAARGITLGLRYPALERSVSGQKGD
jgi:MATE family multidrug resistance protein